MDEILTIREVAARLKLGERTITAMLAGGELPGFKVRGQWRLRRIDFDRWLTAVANGGKVEAVTAGILTGAAEEAPPMPQSTPSPEPAPPRNDEDGQKIEPLTRRVSQVELHRRFLAALGDGVRSHAELDSKPLEA